MGWQPGSDAGRGASPGRDPGLPGGGHSVRDPRLAEFASDGGRDAIVPSGRLALVADEVSGPERRCPGSTDDELAGLLRGWAAIESWASGAKLGVIAEMIGAMTPRATAAATGTYRTSGPRRCVMSSLERWPAPSSRRRPPRGWPGSSRPGCPASAPRSVPGRSRSRSPGRSSRRSSTSRTVTRPGPRR
jgi:hypothetical protein